MKQTRKLVAVEGFGSGDRAAGYARRELERNMDYDDVVVFSFKDAIEKPEELADILHRRRAVGHSAGNMAIHDAMQQFPEARPESVTMVASPIPTDARRLILRARAVFGGEMRDSLRSVDDAWLNFLQSSAMGKELGRHALTHFGAIPAIAKFDSFEFANSLVDRDIPTRLASMEQDDFFPQSSQAFQHGLAHKAPELAVVSIEGRHCRFAQRPSRTLGEIALAPLIEYIPVLEMESEPSESPWRRSAPVPV